MSLITPRSDILTEVGIHLLQSKVQVMWSSHNRASIPSTTCQQTHLDRIDKGATQSREITCTDGIKQHNMHRMHRMPKQSTHLKH